MARMVARMIERNETEIVRKIPPTMNGATRERKSISTLR